ncbi:hypothetical protein D3C78_1726330 [compost metagenome]
MQRGEQALAGDFVQRQAVGAFGQVLLDLLVALGEFGHQGGGAVEMGHHFVLVAVEAFLDVVQLPLGAARGGVGQQAGDQETNGDTHHQGEGRQ